MRKLLVFALSILLLLSVVSAQGSSDSGKIVIRWGSVHTPDSITTQMMNRVIEQVNTGTEGRVEIQGFPSSALGSTRDLVEGVQTGLVDMCTEGPSQFASVGIPVADIAEAPYIWRNREHLSRAMNGEFGKWLNETFLEHNVRLLGTIYYGTRHLTTTDTPVYSPEDVKGMKIRVPESALYMAMIEAWGARATPMNLGELYLSLQTKVVDAQENPLTTFDAQKFYEVQKYVILTSHIICPNGIFINENLWQKISPEDQKVIEDAIAEAIVWHDEQIALEEEALIKELEERGVTIITPDVEAFRAVTAPYIEAKFRDKWGEGTWDMIQAL